MDELQKDDWRLVKTKPPKDLYVLLYNGYWRGVGKWSPDEEAEEDSRYPAWQDECGQWISPEPTHWMLLPPPPNQLPPSNK